MGRVDVFACRIGPAGGFYGRAGGRADERMGGRENGFEGRVEFAYSFPLCYA